MKNYKYVGDGLGVPGLPHVLTDEEAKALGVGDLLKQAVTLGYYVEVTPPPTPPQTKNTFGEGKAADKQKSEVSNG